MISNNNLISENCTRKKMVQEYTILRKVQYNLPNLNCLLSNNFYNNFYNCFKLIHFNFYYE